MILVALSTSTLLEQPQDEVIQSYHFERRLDQATGAHFNLPGHNIEHMTFSVLEKINNNNPQYRKARESHFIEKFNLKYAGMNVKR